MMTLDTVALALGMTPVAMLLADQQGIVRLTNPVCDTLFGYPDGKLCGQPIEVLLPEALRGGHVALREAFAVLPAKRIMGQSRSLSGLSATGATLPLELALEPITVDGVAMTIVTALDLRSDLRNRERIRDIMDAASCTMVVVDDEGRIEFVNSAVTELLGHEPDALLGQTVEMLLPLELRRTHQVYRRSYTSLGGKRTMARGRILHALHRDGQTVSVEGVLNRIELDGEPRVVATLIDLTERLKAEDAMATRARELEQLNSDLSNFNRSVSHDLKAPLASIAGLLGLCREDLDANDVNELRVNLDRALNIAEQSVRDIEDVLRVSLVQGQEMQFEPADLESMLHDLWAGLSGEMKDLRFVPELNHRGPVMTEMPTLRSILRNILSNAIRYRDLEKPELEVRVTSHISDGVLDLVVSDNGIGIPAAFLDEVFGLFKQRGDRGGAGIGLNMVQRNVGRLGGTVTISSIEGEGTQVHLQLPMTKETIG